MESDHKRRLSKKQLKYTLIVAAIIFSSSLTFVLIYNFYSENNSNDPITSFTNIVIDRDSEFKSTYGFPGDGSAENPYIIENYLFEEQEEAAVIIKSTTKVFIIRNCTFMTNTIGISLVEIAPNTATIINSTFIYNERGIQVIQCNIVNITKSIFHSNEEGVALFDSQETTFSKNYCDGNHDYVFIAQNCSTGFFFENTFVEGGNIEFYECNDWLIHHNLNIRTAIYSGYYFRYYDNMLTVNGGILSSCSEFYMYNNYFSGGINTINIASSYGAFILNNTINRGGFSFSTEISVSSFETYAFINNTVNNKPAIFLINENGMVIDNSTFSQVFCINCSNMEINSGYYQNIREAISCFYSTNISIANNIISAILVTGYSSIFGIQLYQCNNILVSNNSIINFDYGINTIKSINVFIEKNYCADSYSGIYVTESEEIIISENNCTRNEYGIYVRYGWGITAVVVERNNCSYNHLHGIDIQDCPYTNISYNMAHHNVRGIRVVRSGGMIKENVLNANAFFGIHCRSDNFVIRNNIMKYNEISGALVIDCDNIKIILNQFIENEGFGLDVTSTDLVAVFANNFIDNEQIQPTSSQAIDEFGTINNIFYNIDSSVGNYWSDWTSGAYFIDGSTGSVDLYPRSVPVII
ncbi:MAG: NosD domain-containing protein [Candidatus Heimdallarchaeota archaeon]